MRNTVENATLDAAKGFLSPQGPNADLTTRLTQAGTIFGSSLQNQLNPAGLLQSTLGASAGKLTHGSKLDFAGGNAIPTRRPAPSGHKDLGKMADNIPGHPQSAQDIYNKGLQGPPPKELYGKSYEVNIPKTVEVNGRKVELPSYTREGVTPNGTKYVMGDKVVGQAYKKKKQGLDNHKPSQQNRGWYPELIQNVLDHPVEKRPGKRDKRYNQDGILVEQGPATDYVAPDGHYITVNDKTGEIIAVSDRFHPDWIDAFHEGRLTIPKMDPKLEKYWRKYNGQTNVAE